MSESTGWVRPEPTPQAVQYDAAITAANEAYQAEYDQAQKAYAGVVTEASAVMLQSLAKAQGIRDAAYQAAETTYRDAEGLPRNAEIFATEAGTGAES